MARLSSHLSFTGSLGELTAYTMRGANGVILRTRSGPTKEEIKHSPAYDITRRNNSEFGGRSTATRGILRGLHLQKPLADYRIAGTLNALLKHIQVLDTESAFGKRSVCLSKQPHLLAGFQLNNKAPFDTIVRTPVVYTLLREELSATIAIAELVPGINLMVPKAYPYYRLQAMLAIVPDVFCTGNGYKADPGYDRLFPEAARTEWFPLESGSPDIHLALQLPTPPVNTAFSVMLSIGICMGEVGYGGKIQQVKKAGAAKIVAVV